MSTLLLGLGLYVLLSAWLVLSLCVLSSRLSAGEREAGRE